MFVSIILLSSNRIEITHRLRHHERRGAEPSVSVRSLTFTSSLFQEHLEIDQSLVTGLEVFDGKKIFTVSTHERRANQPKDGSTSLQSLPADGR